MKPWPETPIIYIVEDLEADREALFQLIRRAVGTGGLPRVEIRHPSNPCAPNDVGQELKEDDNLRSRIFCVLLDLNLDTEAKSTQGIEIESLEGGEVLGVIREFTELQEVPVVIVSSYVEKWRGGGLGSLTIISKPDIELWPHFFEQDEQVIQARSSVVKRFEEQIVCAANAALSLRTLQKRVNELESAFIHAFEKSL